MVPNNSTISLFAAPPNFAPVLSSPSPVIEKSEARLECRGTPFRNETMTYTWRDNKNTVVNSEMEGGVSVVKFIRVSRYNTGNYTCTVTTAGGSITGGPVQLVVHC